ncbi:MAG: type II toxin-antitoxin system RelE/ParE family toxin [Moorea sp. SIOASIH]|uniref:type II toxin-antitoxin system RelE/ParE family toxin n=1 Tax=Moorena sp. SIOASIH TaxID=2607817 RepID=UPI0013BD225A|nr:type II toxin-antitoxin system RelE/ParE family toxin [Moorena sp. SIOASIH]NEO36616.1 type II toxin-antitoxin system RelE/ParE family toxin [Moorena sp. SIOASIH]
MKQYRIDIAPEAGQEIEDIYLYIAEDSPDNAARWYFVIHDKIQTLKDSPARCPLAFESSFYDYEIRNLIVGNYRVLFRIDGQIVQILHVKHGAQERKPF